MRILYVTTGLKSGGAERVVCKLADNYFSKGHTVAILTLISGYQVEPENQNIEIYCLDIRKNSISSMIKGLFKAVTCMKRFRADIVHSHMYHANILSRFLHVLFSKQKLICTAHGRIEGGLVCDILYRITDSIPYISTNVSRSACKDFYSRKASMPHRMIPVYNGIDLDRFDNRYHPKRNPQRLLSVGRLAPEKNLDMILSAMKQVMSIYGDNFELWIVGNGPEYSKLSDLAAALELSGNVTFFGEMAEPEKLMSDITLFVSSSNHEGFGLAIAEAMASGVPVIVTESGGAAEIVDDPKHIVPIDDADALAIKICEFLGYSDHDLIDLGAAGRKRIKHHFSVQNEFSNWDNIYYSQYKQFKSLK